MLEKTERIDQVEILESGHIQVRKVIAVTETAEDGTASEVSRAFHRYVVEPGAEKPEELVAYLGEKLAEGEPLYEGETE
jgi:hypothetical protein